MAHARMYFGERELVVPTPDGPPLRLPMRHVYVWAKFGSEGPIRQAVVDTGCPFCTLPQRVWVELNRLGDVVWVANPPAVPTTGLTGTTALLGASYRFRVGRMRVQIADLGDGQLAAREVVALCTEDGGKRNIPLVLGLAEILNGRGLLLQASDGGGRWAGVVNEP